VTLEMGDGPIKGRPIRATQSDFAAVAVLPTRSLEFVQEFGLVNRWKVKSEPSVYP
jgi:hypothetical protein